MKKDEAKVTIPDVETVEIKTGEANVKVNDLFKEEHVVAAMKSDIINISAEKRVKIIVHNQEGAMGTQPVFVALNGLGMYIPREVEVAIPESILAVLENATETRYYREVIDDVPKGPILSREVRRFPFSITGR